MNWIRIIQKTGKYITLVVISFLSLIPFYILITIGLSKNVGKLKIDFSFLPDFHFVNFILAWTKSGLGISLVNSFVITSGALVILVIFSSSAGYSIARFASPFNRTILNIFLLCMMIPGIINTVALYTLMIKIGGINTRWAMILVLSANSLPFSVFLYTNFIRSIPRDVEESAIIDGCTWFSAFWRVTFHFLKPVTAAVAILQGLGIWNNYAQAVFFLQRKDVRTIPLAISMFFQQYGANWSLMAGAAIIGLAPAVLIFLFFQKFFIKGIISGAVKG
ncbi:MAG: carbohydrate ABC transporter permease [Spirochaetes bacterium]|nr:carbohydrate ABC transporter permease [Spirochaetota bacterium]